MKIHYSFWAFVIAVLCVLRVSSSSVDQEAKDALIGFLKKLSNYDMSLMLRNRWDDSSDPCTARWHGVVCENTTSSITELLLNRTGLSGNLDVTLLCDSAAISRTLSVLLLDGNNIAGMITASISRCHQLRDLNVSRNRLNGPVPDFRSLKNMKRLDISHNGFMGQFPDMSRVSGLNKLAVEYNGLSGRIPALDFSNLNYFNVSYNNFSGSIPDIAGYFNETSFYGNPLLCGPPLKKTCPKGSSPLHECMFMYVGYTMLFLVLFGTVFVKFYERQRKTEKRRNKNKVGVANDETGKRSSPSVSFVRSATMEIKTKASSRLEMSAIPAPMVPVESMQEESVPADSRSVSPSNSLVILSSEALNLMTFDDLLRSPAELLGRGKYTSLYRVECGDGTAYAVKRIREWGISCADFAKRMQRIGRVKHLNVLPAIAFFGYKREKLLIYEFHWNGSLFSLLQGKSKGNLEWGLRLEIAAKTVDALAHLHCQLYNDEIGHGNLKSSNIILDDDMEPRISEYGLKEMGDHDSSSLSSYPSSLAFLRGLKPDHRSTPDSDPSADAFQRDVYNFGLILLELLTGRVVQRDAVFSLTKWVHSVIREEWTVEVFDKSLVSEGASEERLVCLLRVALKCVNKCPDTRPTSAQVASMINAIKEEEERASP